MRIVLCYPVEPRHVRQIAEAAPDAEVVDAGQDRVAAELLAADVFCGHAKRPVDWDAVVTGGRLQWIQSSAAGLDHCLTPAVIESQIIVTSASGVLADQVAEHTVALLTALSRSLPVFFAAQQRKEFIRRPTRDLHGARVLIVGFGGVGRRVAQLLSTFRTTIVACDLFPERRPPYVAELHPADALDELLPEADAVILAVPMTDVTRGMFDHARLGRMKRGAWLINVARGPLVIEEALVEALAIGHLAGAGLDVTAEEPLPTTSRLWDLPGVIITPHVGGQSARRIDDMTDFFCDNLRRFQGGRPLRNLVDKRLGFPTPATRGPDISPEP